MFYKRKTIKAFVMATCVLSSFFITSLSPVVKAADEETLHIKVKGKDTEFKYKTKAKRPQGEQYSCRLTKTKEYDFTGGYITPFGKAKAPKNLSKKQKKALEVFDEEIEKYAKSINSPDFLKFKELIKAKTFQESNFAPPPSAKTDNTGLGDVMQSSESVGAGVNGVGGRESFQNGFKAFISSLSVKTDAELAVVLQGYNFGSGYINDKWAKDGRYSLEGVKAFVAHQGGNYGDDCYVPHVLHKYDEDNIDTSKASYSNDDKDSETDKDKEKAKEKFLKEPDDSQANRRDLVIGAENADSLTDRAWRFELFDMLHLNDTSGGSFIQKASGFMFMFIILYIFLMWACLFFDYATLRYGNGAIKYSAVSIVTLTFNNKSMVYKEGGIRDVSKKLILRTFIALIVAMVALAGALPMLFEMFARLISDLIDMLF